MCGRFTQLSPSSRYAEIFGISTKLDVKPHYNVAPNTQIISALVGSSGEKILTTLRWGLIPHWSKGPDNKYSMINARAETVETKLAYRSSFKHKRCLVPVDGFYEWKLEKGKKQPYYIYATDDNPLALAGIWDRWESGPEFIDSCSIIITEANEQIASIHDRMPVILKQNKWEEWLNPLMQDTNELKSMLLPFQDDLGLHAVSTAVNNPKNDDAALIEHI